MRLGPVGLYPARDRQAFFPGKPGHGEMEVRDAVVQKEGIRNSDSFRAVFVSREGDLISEVGVKTGAGLSCDKSLTDRGQVVPPTEPGLGEFLLMHTEGSLFGNKCLMPVNVSK